MVYIVLGIIAVIWSVLLVAAFSGAINPAKVGVFSIIVVLIAIPMLICTQEKKQISGTENAETYDNAYGSLSDEQKKQVYQYIQSISKKEGGNNL